MVNANKPLDAAVDLAVAVVRFFVFSITGGWEPHGTTRNFTNIQCGAKKSWLSWFITPKTTVDDTWNSL